VPTSIHSPTTSPRAHRFDDLGVPESLVAALEQRGISVPFPIQSATISDALAGRDVCGQAPTGSGKTLAFGLAVLSRLAAKPKANRRRQRQPSALVLVPTRELAAQIRTDLDPLAVAIGACVASVYGGVGYARQVSDLRKGVDVLVACPGRLSDLINRQIVDLSLVEIVVVDEADRMADMGFLPPVRRLIDLTSAQRQMLLFSATLDGPVKTLMRDYQHIPARHQVSADSDGGQVSHHFWRVESHDRTAITAAAVTAQRPAMVFCRTKRGADRLSQRLTRSGLQSAAIHGDRGQGQRDRALAAFKAGRLDALVATDIAARGIHVDAVPLVVHFDPPADHTDYVHRAGRTGRAGADGLVLSLIGEEHRRQTGLIQQKLGIVSEITAPDIPLLASFAGLASQRQARGSGTAVNEGSIGREKSSKSPRPRRQRTRGAVRR
jgi:superfamily II DNA/RNA helicase